MENVRKGRDGQMKQIDREFRGDYSSRSKDLQIRERLKEQLNVLDLGKVFGQLRLLGVVLFAGSQLLHEGTFSLAMQFWFVLVLALGYVRRAIPLVMERPDRTNGRLAENATEEQYGKKPLHGATQRYAVSRSFQS